MPRAKITRAATYMGYEINNPVNGKGCRMDILRALKRQMDQSVNSRYRTLFTRFDLRFPVGFDSVDDNGYLSEFIDQFKKRLEDRGLDPKIVWVREQSYDSNPHYHFVLLTDATRSWSYKKLMGIAERCWANVLGLYRDKNHGLVYYCDGGNAKNGIVILRGSDRQYAPCFYWASYLSKVHTKSRAFVPRGVRQWGQSRLAN